MGPNSQPCLGEKEYGSKCRDGGWLGVAGLADAYPALLVKQSVYGGYLPTLGLLTWYPWQEQLQLEPRKLFQHIKNLFTDLKSFWEFPGGPVVRTWHFHSCGPGFNPWLGS